MKLLSIFLILFSTLTFAQEEHNVDYGKDFIYSSSNTLIYAKKIELKTPFLSKNYILLDSERYDFENVKFFNNAEGFFANLSSVSTYYSGFAERIERGRINLYEDWNYSPGHMTPMGGPGGGMMMTTGSSSRTLYYNKGFGLLKKAKYKNLIIDLADNKASMTLLNTYKVRKNASIGTMIAGGVLFIAGGFSLYKRTNKDANIDNPNLTPSYGLMIGGAVTLGVGSLISLSSIKQLEKSIKIYNK